MVVHQSIHHLPYFRIAPGHQRREYMQLFVLMVEWGCQVKIAHHVTCSLSGGFIRAMFKQMLLQAHHKRQRAFHAFMACSQHVKRGLKSGRGCMVAG